ncbi:MAG: tRNA (adenosine(37)-N6)-dimethylallyltransferase MiaA [Ruminococcaceae bacterium]|nr:tRNA (adenosine(37)-N6)-dimethylallyltransferase MiaA [Oscillospiraceae bacterium]
MSKIPLIVVVGPTASGKSEYALKKAKELGGEIISGDSMQIYRKMDIGTAKPTAEEMAEIPHHLIDVADITEIFSAARFVELASKAINDVYSRGKMPIIAGGTGLYIDTLISGTELSATEDDPILREELFAFAKEFGAEALHQRLREVDPESAQAIHPNNIKRVARALEIYLKTGETKTEADRKSRLKESIYDPYIVYIRPDERETLYERIDRRVGKMFDLGLEEEVKSLYQMGLESTPTASQAIGYKEFYPYFKGETDIESVKQAICLNTRHYAKRQMTWFNRADVNEIITI